MRTATAARRPIRLHAPLELDMCDLIHFPDVPEVVKNATSFPDVPEVGKSGVTNILVVKRWWITKILSSKFRSWLRRS